jgi:recombination protein RecA
MLENITLSQEQQQIILGGLLGDSSFNKKRKTIIFSHSTKQEEYLIWKYSFFNVDDVSKFYHRYYKDGYENKSFEFKNRNHKLDDLYDFLHKHLYSNHGRKKISLKYLNQLTPLGLAIWWMDDGCLSIHKGNRYGKLCTECFNHEEHILLQKYFKDTWGIAVDIKVEKNQYYFLRFNVKALRQLISIIYKYVTMCPSMIYKIDLNYTRQYCIGDFQEIYDYIKKCISNNVLITSTLTTAGCA